MTIKGDDLLISMLASPAAPGVARTLTRTRLERWGYSHISDDAFVVASELITNARTATPDTEIRYQLSRDGDEVLLAVWDSSYRRPRIKPAPDLSASSPQDWDEPGGWGLPIVAALATACGTVPDPGGGKWVWARLKP